MSNSQVIDLTETPPPIIVSRSSSRRKRRKSTVLGVEAQAGPSGINNSNDDIEQIDLTNLPITNIIQPQNQNCQRCANTNKKQRVGVCRKCNKSNDNKEIKLTPIISKTTIPEQAPTSHIADVEFILQTPKRKRKKNDDNLRGVDEGGAVAGPSGHSEFQGFQWKCKFCTLMNVDLALFCEACKHSREEKMTEEQQGVCPICFDDDVKLVDWFEVECCGHTVCKTCAKTMVETEMRSNNVPVPCPVCKTKQCAQCKLRTPVEGVQQVCVLSQQDIRQLLDQQEFERYINIEGKQSFQQLEFFTCPGKNCTSVYEIEEGQIQFICPTCEFKFCLPCGVEWHEGSTCEKYQQWRTENEKADEKFAELKDKLKLRTCPKCKNGVIKESVHHCNKITCTNCRIIFCWVCQSKIQGYHHFSDKKSSCYGKLWEGVAPPQPQHRF